MHADRLGKRQKFRGKNLPLLDCTCRPVRIIELMQELSTPIPPEPRTTPASQSFFASLKQQFHLHRLRLLVSGLLLAGLLVAFVVMLQHVSLAEIWSYVRAAHWQWLAVTFGLLLAGQMMRVVRSMRLLQWDRPADVKTVSQAVYGGQTINWLSPLRIGDVWRVWRVSSDRPGSLIWTASSVVIEKSTDSLVLAGLAALLLFSPLPAGFSVPLVRLLSTALIGVLLVTALSAISSTRLRDKILGRLPKVDAWLKSERGRAMLPPALGLRNNWKRWLELLLYTSSVWLIALLTNVALAFAFNIHIGLVGHVLLLLALQTTSVFAPVPGNVGVFPVVCLGVMTVMGVTAPEAIAYGSVLYVMVYGALLVMALIAFGAPLAGRLLARTTDVTHATES
jgi:uncharacterized membrane protein YbhN (UPF0104 family)